MAHTVHGLSIARWLMGDAVAGDHLNAFIYTHHLFFSFFTGFKQV